MIRIQNLQKRFGSFHALKGIDLNVEGGEIYGFLGHNGAGKTTTMNILAGLSRADRGSCLVNGWDLSKVEHPGDLHIGYLPEEPQFYPWMTGRETLLYLGSKWRGGSIGKRVDEMLEWVGLTHAGSRRVGGYSRGMKQRLGMAQALLYDAELLLLDEPSSALDPEGRSDVLKLILDLKDRGKTVFLSTHILSDVERVCDRVGILVNGKMVMEKTLRELLAGHVQSVYDVVLQDKNVDSLPERIKQLPGITDVSASGEKIAVCVDAPESAGNMLLSFLGSAGVSVACFSLRHASLEDIFLEEVSKNGV